MTSSATTVAGHGEPRMLINGSLSEAASGARYGNINPATEEVIGKQLHSALNDEKKQLRAELVAEAGTPVSITYLAQLDWPLDDAFTHPTKMISEFPWERDLAVTKLFGGTNNRRVHKEAVDVVAAITPWNFPFEVAANKIAPALATGNTVALKPASDTPWNATRIGRLVAEEMDIPDVVTTSDNSVAQPLLTDPRVDRVSFTGSTGVGRLVAELAASTLKYTYLELGGKSIIVVLDDTDFDPAVQTLMVAAMHAGQICALPSRLLVPRKGYDEAVQMATAIFGSIADGDPRNPTTFSGPEANKKQHERVLGYIEKGNHEGARVTVEGQRPPELERGYIFQRTVFADVDTSTTIAQEEIFGPVLTVIDFDDDDDAIRVTNDSAYGLFGNLFGTSPDPLEKVTRGIRTGSLNVNGAMFYGPDAPFGGYKRSRLRATSKVLRSPFRRSPSGTVDHRRLGERWGHEPLDIKQLEPV